VDAYVTDTHPLLWYVARQTKLSKLALRIFTRADRGEVLIYVPGAVLLECGILERIGRFRPKEPFGTWAEALFAQPGFELAQPDSGSILEALSWQMTNDPFDLSIIATAKSKNLPLITADQLIQDGQIVEIAW
jgi:PIN domain nuclease of toxin-antitoxin system